MTLSFIKWVLGSAVFCKQCVWNIESLSQFDFTVLHNQCQEFTSSYKRIYSGHPDAKNPKYIGQQLEIGSFAVFGLKLQLVRQPTAEKIEGLFIAAHGFFTQLGATAIKHKFIGKPLEIQIFIQKILLFIGVNFTQ